MVKLCWKIIIAAIKVQKGSENFEIVAEGIARGVNGIDLIANTITNVSRRGDSNNESDRVENIIKAVCNHPTISQALRTNNVNVNISDEVRTSSKDEEVEINEKEEEFDRMIRHRAITK